MVPASRRNPLAAIGRPRGSGDARQSVGICDVTTLGKIDVQGTDAAEFLNRIYANAFAKLAVGKVRYGLMLREDGIAMDDGTTARLAEDHFVMTTTTANAVGVYRHMEFCRQCLWPDLDVQLISTTEAWAQYAVAGPNARKLLQKIVDPEFDISNEAFPFMACGEITVCGGLRARLFRISFSGELAYEIAVPTRYGDALIRAMMAGGARIRRGALRHRGAWRHADRKGPCGGERAERHDHRAEPRHGRGWCRRRRTASAPPCRNARG